MPLRVRPIAHGSADYAAAVNLRRAILRTPLGLDFTSAQLAAEAGDTHLGAFDDDDLVGTVLIAPYDDTTVKLRQMAVDDDQQGKGIGAQLLSAAEDAARAAGKTRITLAARLTAQAFYERHGYAAEGDVFDEVTLPHISMHKSL
ncbi:GNAT family N-acetyltransferase [Asticcacaulis sp. 201]|uniref:GNAT family N-acetyltransferase n=1 Tax=Asticcacaulis sp. 201 TaxID=3028787 RepID=UPI002915F17F|nr:GNAT family N-acetyltransferase [Asticcacaulis sp. 201]MDV6329852.1 GNAT family N-acetyltransferase [Asticcacaulis sp. 201]